jgi:hypothetical protein
MLMKIAVVLLAASTLTVLAITAKAATIQNNDKSAYQLRIVENGQEQKIELKPSLAATGLCNSKCELYFGDDPDPYDVVSADALVIEGGQLFGSPEPASESGTSN